MGSFRLRAGKTASAFGGKAGQSIARDGGLGKSVFCPNNFWKTDHRRLYSPQFRNAHTPIGLRTLFGVDETEVLRDRPLGTGHTSATIRVMNRTLSTPSGPLSPNQSNRIRSLWRQARSLVALCLLVGLLIVSLPAAVYADTDLSQLSSEGERAAQIINQLRANAGLSPLRVHPLLTLAANLHIQDMISSGVWGHYSSDGSSVHTRIARAGYVTNGWNGENWAVYDTVETSIGWWMTDPPHRDNVLNRSYTEMGIGTAPHPNGWGLILVVDFSTGNTNGAEGYVPESAPVVTAISQPISTTPVADSGLRYTVSPGDTLYSIGLRYGVDWQSIAQLNSLNSGRVLSIGVVLRIPGNGQPKAVDAASGNAMGSGGGGTQQYTVAAGDTLLGIALRFGMTWQTLAGANGLGEFSLLQIGDVLTIPGTDGRAATEAAAEPVSVARTHTVQPGETVWVIAARHGVDWRALLQANGLGEQALLQIGQVLALP